MRFIFTGWIPAFITCLLACLIAQNPAQAQRTMKGQFRLDAGAHYSFTGPTDLGGQLMTGQFLLNGYWEAGLDGALYTSAPSKGNCRIEHVHLSVQGGYMHRLVSTRNRRLCLYGGGTAFLGYELYDPWNHIPDHVHTGLKNGSFLYGIKPSIELEFYLSRSVALFMRGDMPLNFSSPLGLLHFRLGAGVRVCL